MTSTFFWRKGKCRLVSTCEKKLKKKEGALSAPTGGGDRDIFVRAGLGGGERVRFFNVCAKGGGKKKN